MSNASAYLVAAPDIKPPARVVPMVVTAFVHVIAIVGLVKGLTVVATLQSPPDITVMTVPEMKKPEVIENLPTLKNPVDSFTFDQPKEPEIFYAPDPPFVPPETNPWIETGGTIEVPTSAHSVVVAPKLQRSSEPPYPNDAIRRQEEGVVKLMLTVAANGRVTHAHVLQSSGFPSLDKSALEAVHSWRYSPAQRDGVAVTESIAVLVRFALK